MRSGELSASDNAGRQVARRAARYKGLEAGSVLRGDPGGLIQVSGQGHLSHAQTPADCHPGPERFLHAGRGAAGTSHQPVRPCLRLGRLTGAGRPKMTAPESVP